MLRLDQPNDDESQRNTNWGEANKTGMKQTVSENRGLEMKEGTTSVYIPADRGEGGVVERGWRRVELERRREDEYEANEVRGGVG